MSVSIAIILDTRRMKKKTAKFPAKLRIIHEREPRDYQTIFDLSVEEFNKLRAPRINAELVFIKETFKDLERKADGVVRQLDPFSFSEFEKDFIVNNSLFHQRKSIRKVDNLAPFEFDVSQYAHRFPIFKQQNVEAGTILATFLSYIDNLLRENRIGSASAYQTSYFAIAKFKGNIKFTSITVSYLNQFEGWMLAQDYSKTTIGIYLRSLRAIFNEAIANGTIKREKCYPFGRRKYQIPTGRNIKKSLSLEDVSKIYYYEPECEQEKRAKDFWLFSYFANGINPKDIAFLKYKNIEGEYLVYERAKTEKSSRSNPKPISVFITDDLWRTIKRWGNQDNDPHNYIFPILKPSLTPMRQYELVELFICSINDWMAKIRQKLKIEKKVTTYVARHTFSTVLKRSGVSTEFIQEALGHTNIRTTENYLDSFEKEVKKEFANKLIAFKDEFRNTAP